MRSRTAVVAGVIWEQTRMGGTCHVRWEFQVKWVTFSQAACVCVCVGGIVASGFGGRLCMCERCGDEHLGVFLKYQGGQCSDRRREKAPSE